MKETLFGLLKKHRRFLTFAVIGGVNTLLDFLVYTVLCEFFGLAVDISHAFGYSTGIVCSFILNRTFTFKKGSTTGIVEQIVKFLMVNGVTGFLSTALIKWLYLIGLNKYVAKAFVIGVVMILNYLGYKLFVFVVKSRADKQ